MKLNQEQQDALKNLQQSLVQATVCGLFDEMTAHVHPDRINAFCDDVATCTNVMTMEKPQG